jgi:hypothetical protein
MNNYIHYTSPHLALVEAFAAGPVRHGLHLLVAFGYNGLIISPHGGLMLTPVI